jgi:hypothetical protein
MRLRLVLAAGAVMAWALIVLLAGVWLVLEAGR